MRACKDQSSSAVPEALERDKLRSSIHALVTLDQDEAPIVSCYVDRGLGRRGSRSLQLERSLRTLRTVLSGQELGHFEEAIERTMRFLATDIRPATRGVATFSRAGTKPFFLSEQLHVALPDQLSVNARPDVYHLAEIKDTDERYVVLISTEEQARIIEVNLGLVTRELWAERPELREHLTKVSTHQHYQNHQWDRGERFLKEKIGIIQRVLSAGGRTRLILAGGHEMTARIRKCLPAHLRAALMEFPHPSSSAPEGDLLAATLSSLRNGERQEPLDTVAELVNAIRNGGLGTAGTGAVLDALLHCQVDVLVMDRAYEPGQAWSCRHCGCAAATPSPPERCPGCDSNDLQSDDVKAVMVRLAEEQSLEVEIVEDSDLLRRLGGVGCLLRYARPKQVRMAVPGRSA